MNSHDDEMFDDLHQGVEALRTAVHTQSIPVTDRISATLQRLESSMPAAKNDLREWKQRLKDGAVKFASKTDVTVHKYPWFFVISALGLGLMTGWVLGSTGEEENSTPSA